MVNKFKSKVFFYTEVYPTSENTHLAPYLYHRVSIMERIGIEVFIIKTSRGSNYKSVMSILKSLLLGNNCGFDGQKVIKLFSPNGFFKSQQKLPNNNLFTGLLIAIQNYILITKFKPEVLIFHFLWYSEPLYWLRFFKFPIKKSILHLHGSDVNYISSINFKKQYLDLTIGRLNAIIFSSNNLKSKFNAFTKERFENIPKFVTYNGWTNDRSKNDYKSPEIELLKLKKKEGFRIISYIGNLYKDKGINEFFLVAKISKISNPRDYFVCIGGGEIEQQLRKKAKDKGINLLVLGPKSPESVYDFLEVTDILVNPSKSEGFSTINIEAQSFGKIVLCFDVGGNNEGIFYKEFLMTWNDSLRFRVNLILQKLDAMANLIFDKKSIKRSVDYFNWESIVNREIEIFKS
jgi:glycosyltransferase involved in cell wall biosynthesis